MSLPRFFTRAADAAAGTGSRLTAQVLSDRLLGVTVALSTDAGAGDQLGEGFLLATNLLSRLYPRLLLTAPDPLRQQAEALATAINPEVCLAAPDDGQAGGVFRLHLGAAEWSASASDVVVGAAGWVVAVDTEVPAGLGAPAAAAALAAAAVGVGEIFDAVFSEWTDRPGRHGARPAVWDLVTSRRATRAYAHAGMWTGAADPAPDIGTVVLAGAGAVGQAAVLTWRAAGARGHLVPVDDESVDVGNLQRYVLTDDNSEEQIKTDLIARALAGSPLTIQPVTSRWGEDPASGPFRETVAVALDTADARVSVAAGTHHRVYNAWTGPGALGWSRHESFGKGDPCLACAYWPKGPQPSLHENIAVAIGQHPLRIRMYLAPEATLAWIPPEILGLPGLPLPEQEEAWRKTSLVDALVASGHIPAEDAQRWASRHVLDLWHEGICGGTLARPPGSPVAVEVPVAHASALAGIMLAAQILIAADPELARRRDPLPQGRIDGQGPLPNVIGRPRQPTPQCLCGDAAFRAAWDDAWGLAGPPL